MLGRRCAPCCWCCVPLAGPCCCSREACHSSHCVRQGSTGIVWAGRPARQPARACTLWCKARSWRCGSATAGRCARRRAPTTVAPVWQWPGHVCVTRVALVRSHTAVMPSLHGLASRTSQLRWQCVRVQCAWCGRHAGVPHTAHGLTHFKKSLTLFGFEEKGKIIKVVTTIFTSIMDNLQTLRLLVEMLSTTNH